MAVSDRDTQAEASPEEAQAPEVEVPPLSEVPLQVTVRLGSARLTLGELLQLQQGSVLLLDREIGEPAEIMVGDRVVALGEMVRVDDELGIRVTRVSTAAGTEGMTPMPPPNAALPHAPAVYLLQALLSLALVVALIYGAYWLLRRSGVGGRDARTTRGGPAELVQSLPLHGAYVLHVVRLAGRLLAVTCGPGGVAVKELGAGDEAEGEAPAGQVSGSLHEGNEEN